MKYLFSLIISFAFFLESYAQELIHVDLTKAKFEEVNAERVFKDIEIIPLETHKDGLLKIRSTSYYITDNYIIAAVSLERAYLFDRKTGKFIREVSSIGQGPNEYAGWIYNKYGFNEKNNILFAADTPSNAKFWKCINIETNKIESVMKRPLPEKGDEYFYPYLPWLIKEGVYVSFCDNRTGKDKVKLVVHDKNGTVIKKYPNYLEYNKISTGYDIGAGMFYYYNGLTYFKEKFYNDTIFCVTENSVSPHAVFKLGNKQPSSYYREDKDYNREKYLINFVSESDAFILFNFNYYTDVFGSSMGKIPMNISTHTGYYDKKTKQAYISSTPDLKKSGYTISGIPVRFYPIALNGKREMVASIDPEELVEYKDKIDPKYKSLFRDLQEDDNPIVIIAKLK